MLNNPESYVEWVKFFSVRTLIILTIWLVSSTIPNISILITFLGALQGTILNVWIPVLFYNRAYNSSYKNIALKKMSEIQRETLEKSGAIILSDPKDPDSEPIDGRRWIKIFSWVMFVCGTIVGVYSFVYVIVVFAE